MNDELNIVECVQGDKDWWESRLGMLTSSRVASALAVPKRNGGAELQSRQDVKLELAIERIIRKPMEHYVSEWMERGAAMEPLARGAYELRTGAEVRQVGFVLHPSIRWAGCSPDGLVGERGMVEFKCPKATTHARYLIAGIVPPDYLPQMHWQLACCLGREWNDFVSYHPDFPEPMDLFVRRLECNKETVKAMETTALEFLQQVDEMEKVLRESMSK